MKIDLGCGTNKKEGFLGADQYAMPGVDVVCNLATARWPWDDDSVEEAHTSHFVEHLTASERIHFANELHRVLKPKSQATIIVPHWASSRAYGDLTHQWPPVSEFWACYLNAEWRKSQAPHNDGYTCDFDWVTGFSPHPMIAARNQEFQQFATAFYKEAVQDLHITLTKRATP